MFRIRLLVLNIIFLQTSNCLENQLARTPPMGWMHWERFRCVTDCQLYPDECISERLFKDMADRIAADGFKEAGYEYVIIDDCWSSKERDQFGRLQPDPVRFPSGIKALADYVHDKGLKLGIYGDYGTLTCGGYPGSIKSLELDANTFAEWGVDYLKLDGCYADLEGMEEGYAKMSRYLVKSGRSIVFSCSFPAYKGLEANYTVAVDYCNLWRNYGDIDDSWQSVMNIANWFSENQNFLKNYAGPGHWNDPDMLIIGNFGLSLEQSKSQMTIWALLAAPLLMSVDLRTIQEEYREILLNKDAIRINQDTLGIQGLLVKTVNDINIWTKPILPSYEMSMSYGIGIVSYRTDGYIYRLTFKLSDIGLNHKNGYVLLDVFDPSSENDNKPFLPTDEIVVKVKPSGAVLLIAEPFEPQGRDSPCPLVKSTQITKKSSSYSRNRHVHIERLYNFRN